jgi:hypothetical protein
LVEDYQQLPFQTAVQQMISKGFQEVDFFGLDNHSAPEMITYAGEMIQRSSQMLIVIEPHSEKAHLAKLIRLFNQLNRKKPLHVYVALLGKHPLVEKMMKTMEARFRLGIDLPQLKLWAASLFA